MKKNEYYDDKDPRYDEEFEGEYEDEYLDDPAAEDAEYADEEEYYDDEYEDAYYEDDYYEDEDYAPKRSSSRRSSGHYAPPPKKSRRRKRRRVIWIIVGVLILAVLVAGVLIFRHMFGLMHDEEKIQQYTSTPAPTAATETQSTPVPTPEETATPVPLTEEELAEIEETNLRNALQEDAEEIMYSDDVYNILLIGCDSWSSDMRSDSMILLSINKSSKKIWLTSFMRDTQVFIPNWGIGHLNWAIQFGGVDMLIDTLESEKNFGIHIDNWALIEFYGFLDVADMLTPITVEVAANQVKEMNYCLYDSYAFMYKSRNSKLWADQFFFPEGGGTCELTRGGHVLAYCRERHVSGDTGRSQKQRECLTKMFENAKKLSLKEQYQLVEKAMSVVTTDISSGKCASLLLQAPTLLTYEINAQQCPTPGAFWKGRDDSNLSIYNADFRVNRNFLRATIYDDKSITTADLTSNWTGQSVTVYYPEG